MDNMWANYRLNLYDIKDNKLKYKNVYVEDIRGRDIYFVIVTKKGFVKIINLS